MKRVVFFILFLPAICFSQGINIIPAPNHVEIHSGYFKFEKGLSIRMYEATDQSLLLQRQFAEMLFAMKDWKVPVSTESSKNVILRLLPGKNDSTSAEAYSIKVFPDSILVQATTYNGLFYGCQSAAQLLKNAILSNQVPCMDIEDAPQYVYRGMHLDVCRHFFSKEILKQYLDLMASLKLNVFHWHLTDDQGWRIEIKKYPRLIEVGAWRTEKDGTRYGGFYSQDDIREIVQYARERFITVIPEIELPGHSSAAIVAYPWLSCSEVKPQAVPTTWGIKPDIYCPTDTTLHFIKNVLDEVCSLFPAPYIHMGGDEAPKKQWKTSTAAQEVIKKNNLKDEEELQHYFLKLIEEHLATKGKRCIGWGEIVKGGLSDSVIVMSWLDKSAGLKAAEHGNEVIMTPRFFCYFDYPQNIKYPKHAWWMVYLPLNKVYRFNPQPSSLEAAKRHLILGGQANVWTEYITNEKELHGQVMPRLTAMAEALWTKDKNFESFKSRLETSAVFAPK